jgi:hypothetical protein
LLVVILASMVFARRTTAGPRTDALKREWERIRKVVGIGSQGLNLGRGAAGAGSLVITGPKLVPLETVRQAVGVPPKQVAVRKSWASGAVKLIKALYRARGYTYARAWAQVELDGRVRIDVDEGKIQLVFVGAGTFSSFLYRIDLLPPERVYHRPTVTKSLAELKRKHGLVNAYHRVIDASPPVVNRLGQLVPQRELRVYVITDEFFGWSPGIEVTSTWGIVPDVTYTAKEMLLSKDRFLGELEMAVPFRRLFTDQDPQFQWVHGRMHLAYQFPGFLQSWLAPLVDGSTSLSRYSRSDGKIEEYLDHRGEALAYLAFMLPGSLRIQVGGGMDYSHAFDLVQDPEARLDDPLPDDQDRFHFLSRVEVSKSFGRNVLRRDLRDEMRMRLSVGTSGAADLLVDLRFWGQLSFNLGRHDLLIRTRGVFLTGDIRFWDEVELAGQYLRCHFDSRYWVREALQGSIELRFAIARWFKVGVFHDLSGFFDLSRHGDPLSAADAFGPSLHFLLFDLFSFDIYYAFGFSPSGFSHNLSFRLQRAF